MSSFILDSSVPLRGKRNLVTSPWLLVSLLVHALAVVIILLFADGRPGRPGAYGSGRDDSFSVTWIPGEGGGGGNDVDTVVPGADEEMLVEAISPVPAQASSKKQALLAVVETDPQEVFNNDLAESPSFEKENPLTIAKPLESMTTVSARTSVSSLQEATPSEDQRRATATSYSSEADSDSSRTDSPNDRPGLAGGNSGAPAGTGGSSAGGDHRLSFFGILSHTKRVVFVIDASESMRRHKAMDIARAELWRSLNQLESTAHFQIVFFDLKTHVINRPGERSRLLRATPANLRVAEHFMKGIQPDAGTDRLAAVTQAFSFDPDVIYLLTDADDPEMSAQDLWEIRRGNKRKAAIHVVEFGVGADLGQDSFLKRLARQNGGQHYYRDLTKSPGSK